MRRRYRRLSYRLLRRVETRILVRTLRAAWSDQLSDWAAALTYYSMLSLFPALLLAVAALSLVGPVPAGTLAGAAGHVGPEGSGTLLADSVRHLQQVGAWSAPIAIAGLLSGLWTASGYIGAFIRAADALYAVAESRSRRRTILLQLSFSIVLVLMIVFTGLGFVVTDGVAGRFGGLLSGVPFVHGAWGVLKWVALALVVSFALSLLYWVAPNVPGQRFRWPTGGSTLALVVWLAGSAGLSFYASHFDSFNKVYGSLAAAVVFLIWLWVTNFAVLLGAVVDAQRARPASTPEAVANRPADSASQAGDDPAHQSG
ncbi:YihY/virulence factor BrkB family protein [Nocardia sp. NBC_00416]|uniref:YihY/virulence factor BrkB family protein n=1 Tax=Nocardia sp. NBC_00416 TaxID=2975991 RepID=UPI002E1D2BC4